MMVLAIVAALAAGFCNALAAVLQQGAAKRLAGREGLSPYQLAVLVRQRRWLAGQTSDTAAFLLQAAALSAGALLLVQPILVLALPFTVLLRSALVRQRPDRRAVLGTGSCVVGTSVFLLLANPRVVAPASIGAREWLAMGVGLAVVVGAFLAMALLTQRNWRALGFALAAAALYGVTAGLVKVTTGQLAQGVLVPLRNPELYVAVLTGIAGVVFTQNALKPGALAAPVAVLTLGDPLVGLIVGLLWLGERITATPGAVAGEVLALAAVVLGVVALARQSPTTAAPTGASGDRAGG